MQETRILFLCWQDPLEEEMATLSSIPACRIPWTEEHGRLQSMGSQESDTTEWLSLTQPSLWSIAHIHTWYWKTIALTRQTFVGQVMSLLFNTLSRFVITFLPRSKHLWFIAKLRGRCRDGYPAPHIRRFFPPWSTLTIPPEWYIHYNRWTYIDTS